MIMASILTCPAGTKSSITQHLRTTMLSIFGIHRAIMSQETIWKEMMDSGIVSFYSQKISLQRMKLI